jgi:hypothetical protein
MMSRRISEYLNPLMPPAQEAARILSYQIIFDSSPLHYGSSEGFFNTDGDRAPRRTFLSPRAQPQPIHTSTHSYSSHYSHFPSYRPPTSTHPRFVTIAVTRGFSSSGAQQPTHTSSHSLCFPSYPLSTSTYPRFTTGAWRRPIHTSSHSLSSSRLAPHRLQLTLDPSSSQSPKDTQLGFVFGTDEECCDVLLLGVEGISKRHFCVTFDKKRRVVLRDISDYGTRVSYGGQGEAQLRRNFTWILFDNLDDIQVILGPNDNYKIRFKVELELHNDCNDTYCKVKYHDNIDDYILNLGSTDSIYYRVKEIGKGGFAIVNEVLDVSTGLTLAGKLLSVTRVSPSTCP